MDIRRRHFLKLFGQGSLAVGALAAGYTPVSRPVWEPESVRSDEAFWRMVRAQYPLAHDPIYLNTGGLGPASYRVLDEVQRTMMRFQTVPDTGHRLIEEAREPLATFFGAKASELAFMRNATEANSTIASGLQMSRGDEVIFESHAHPGGSLPWMNRQKQDGVRVRLFEPDTESAAGNLERIAALINPRTRAIQVSHVTAPTGIRFPVAEIARLARDRGVWFHIDGAQSAGMFGFDLHAIGCDSYAASGHKWMGAPHGTGVFYIREDRLDEIRQQRWAPIRTQAWNYRVCSNTIRQRGASSPGRGTQRKFWGCDWPPSFLPRSASTVWRRTECGSLPICRRVCGRFRA
jgi:selenocysteine lyase/cysteine desulfurase